MSSGWIKLHRKLWDNPVVTKDADHLAIWIYLLTNATHEKYRTLYGGKEFYLKPGQLIIGRKKVSKDTHVNEYKIPRILNFFESAQQIAQQKKPYGTVITILNWRKYQILHNKMHNECTTNAQRVHTKQEHKEHKESSSVNHTWLSDALTDKEWDRLTKTYANVTALIDLVDNQIVEPTEIEKPYKYILGVANNLNWPRKDGGK